MRGGYVYQYGTDLNMLNEDKFKHAERGEGTCINRGHAE